MKIFKEEITLPKDSIYEQLEGLNGKQCYDKFGLKRDEALTLTVTFPNEYQADIKMCVCGEEYNTFGEMVLFNKEGVEICFSEPTDSIIGEWELEDIEGNIYHIDVEVEE